MSRPTIQTNPDKQGGKSTKRDPVASGERDAAQNRLASHNYYLTDKLETGIVLRGTEVKSVREGQVQLRDAYALIRENELFLLNAHIGQYSHSGYASHEPTRSRKLLAKADEIRKLFSKTQQKGFTLVPTRVYFRHGKVKVEIALAKGKQTWDKRETERRREADKEARAAISRSRRA
jgi:SsrA-binding protein